MNFLDIFWGLALRVSEKINAIAEPFEEFTRPLEQVDHMTITEKADVCWTDVLNHWRFGPLGEFYWNEKPCTMGDMTFHQGFLTAAAVLRGDKEAVSLAVRGHEKLQKLGGDDRLNRGADAIGGPHRFDAGASYHEEDGYVFIDNVSEGTLIGHLFGLWSVAYMVHDFEDEAKKARRLIVDLARQICKDGYQLLNHDGTAAKHGDLRPNVKTVPVRMSALCALLLMAYRISGEDGFGMAYEKIARSWKRKVSSFEGHFLWIHPHFMDILGYMTAAMLISCEIENSDLRESYIEGLERLWKRTRKEGNPFYTFLVMATIGTDEVRDIDVENAIKTLNEFNVSNPDHPTGREAIRVRNSERPDLRTKKWGKKRVAVQPLPVWRRPATDNYFQRSPYGLDGGPQGDGKGNLYQYNRLDLVLAEALGKEVGAL